MNESSLQLINQIFEIEQKLKGTDGFEKIERNLNRISNIFETDGYKIINPLGEKYNETRTDCEASIAGTKTHNLTITQVIKPIIYQNINGQMSLAQKAIIIVE